MAKINKLPKHMADLIAAGEVVERPASVVKELMENAVDAGATSITVEIQRGGITYIRVTDDGCGIQRDDVKTAFVSHATSKIKTEEDLNTIMTLGFRGEALPSIAAVSKVNMITKTADEEMGTSLTIEGGIITDFSDAGCAVGTTMIVRELFYNTPARMKFLKKDVSEGNYVSAAVEKLALSHPEISIRFIRDGKQVFTTNGDGSLQNVCFSAFGKDFSNGLLKVDGAVGNVSVSGLITPPFNCRGSRGMQYFFVNGRSVKNTTIMAALENAYKNSVMVGKFPGCVLFISLPPTLVDVNVHPSKIEVRFSDERGIFDAVYHSVKSALSESTAVKQVSLPDKAFNSAEYFARPQQDFKQTTVDETIAYMQKVFEPLSTVDFVSDVKTEYSADNDDDPFNIEFPISASKVKADEIIEPVEVTVTLSNKDIRLVGEAYKTYIFIEVDGKLYVIDKHAAHERILFNKLKNNTEACGSQMLLAPVTVALGKEEYSAILENLDAVSKTGFDIEDFGNGAVIVRSCPMDLDNCEIEPLVSEIAEHLTKNSRDIKNEHLDWIYHNVACRSAIKAGDTNTDEELLALAKQVVNDNDVRFCPHGRPVMIELSKYELEKQFGRV